MTKTARVYKIEMLIRNRGHVSFQALLDELEVSPATLKRDLDYLRDRLGARIVYDLFLNGYKFDQEYRGQEHELSGIWFNEREIYSRHLQPVLERIHQMLSTSESETKRLLKRLKIVGSAKRPVPSQFFELVGEALLKRKRLHLRYITRVDRCPASAPPRCAEDGRKWRPRLARLQRGPDRLSSPERLG